MKGWVNMVTAMLFAGGIGARMKYSDMPKQFLEVGGKPIIIHTMEHFARHPKVRYARRIRFPARAVRDVPRFRI